MPFKVSERYPNFGYMIEQAREWWKDHVEGGISPYYNEKADSAILDELRTNSLSPDTDIQALIAEAEGLKEYLDANSKQVAYMEKRLKTINEMLKEFARDGDFKVEIPGAKYNWVLSRGTRTEVDKDALVRDGLWENYQRTVETYRMTIKSKEDK